jgi:flavocytochrome c
MSAGKKDNGTPSRRRFLTGAGQMVIGGIAANELVAGAQAKSAANAKPVAGGMPAKWDETYDVVIIGSGFAGLSAAIEARNTGAKVLVIDKMRVAGGNSAINGGEFAAPGNKWQKEAGIKDSPDLLYSDMMKAGAYLNHPELVRTVADNALKDFEWCQDYVGARFHLLVYHGGHSVKRSVQTINASGSELVNALLAKATSLGVSVVLATKMERLVADPHGRIVGIEIRKNYRFPDEQSGKPAFIKASRAVVLTAGGFSQNIKLRQIHDPKVTEKYESTNHPGATGEAMLEACKIGAMNVQLDWIQMGPWTSPDEKGFGQVPQFCERLVGYGPMVDPATGKRFIQETGNRKVRADAMMLIGHPTVILGDSVNVARQILPETMQKGMENGSIKKFDSLDDLAKAYDMPIDVLKAEVEKWNGFVAAKKDPDFNCMIFAETTPTAVAPFYAARLWPRVHYTMGGLVINKDAQVKDLDMEVLKGLYAAGEIAGGVHGAVRLGTCSMLGCIVFGRIAGRNAAAEKAWV